MLYSWQETCNKSTSKTKFVLHLICQKHPLNSIESRVLWPQILVSLRSTFSLTPPRNPLPEGE